MFLVAGFNCMSNSLAVLSDELAKIIGSSNCICPLLYQHIEYLVY
ncbi:hypothetical protein Lalb_Chr24g0399671 [Lupinus albus]|uniref:Uncharacterized protein n=1 Tax=Lupinus albus TaxID=3870 RepID=A0A6A4N0B9_LUPAL|nr:hypothetical protein Lalb_Chr24g0399671 [Lupinus albus]